MTAGSPSISADEHLAAILAATSMLAPQSVPLDLALGRVLASDVLAQVDVPSFDNSSMDGYAVRLADVATASTDNPVTLDVVADLAAGTQDDPLIRAGQCARIMTGAPTPGNAEAIVPIEDTDRGTDRVVIHVAPAPAAFIRRAGSDTRAGDPVLTAGIRLTARHLAAAAASGSDSLTVHLAPRVGILSTGSELAAPGGRLHRGQIHDSNSTLLAAAVAEAGGIPVVLGRVADDEAEFHSVLTRHAADVDAFLLSGGVSVGAYDVVKAVLSKLGSVQFSSVRMQPGKPQGFGRWSDGTPIFALPGNPVSAFVSFEVFVRPALRAMQGYLALQRPVTVAIAESGWSCPPGRRQYMPVTVTTVVSRADLTDADGPDADGQLLARPAASGGSGSHLATGLAAADGLAIIDETVDEVRAGEAITVMLVES
ncbi:gephyrin-like molybdotransferase Glp [Glaciibacter superstes]|uniref:molybdopterin molybdotransferase MoeA n=1 Tax=Glaciibacter superstes TaxID=501023 RepID=UPI0003B4FB9C|nr:gephyrin-like molybdotransferase Glp [Glaciibacter superstes]